MSLVMPVVRDTQGLQRSLNFGDVFTAGERIVTNATAGAATLTAEEILSGILFRSGPGAGYADTLPTSTDLLNGMLGNTFVGTGAFGAGSGVQPGTTFRFQHINSVAQVMTLTTNTGMTLGANTAIAASSTKTYLFTVLNGSPQQTFFGTITNGSAVVTGMSLTETDKISVGMLVTGTGIAALATVASVQPGVGFTLSANATATGTNSLVFHPRFQVNSLGQTLL